jgi:hypothetical protein
VNIVIHGLTWAMLGHGIQWNGGDVTGGGGVMCLRGSYANEVTDYRQWGLLTSWIGWQFFCTGPFISFGLFNVFPYSNSAFNAQGSR